MINKQIYVCVEQFVVDAKVSTLLGLEYFSNMNQSICQLVHWWPIAFNKYLCIYTLNDTNLCKLGTLVCINIIYLTVTALCL